MTKLKLQHTFHCFNFKIYDLKLLFISNLALQCQFLTSKLSESIFISSVFDLAVSLIDRRKLPFDSLVGVFFILTFARRQFEKFAAKSKFCIYILFSGRAESLRLERLSARFPHGY